MALTRREKVIVLFTAAALGVFAYDRLLLTPVLTRCDELAAQEQRLSDELAAGMRTLRLRRELSPRWREMTATLIAADPTPAESNMLHAVRGWSRDARLNLVSITPQRPTAKGDLKEIVVAANATGPMSGVARFLYMLDHSKLPLRVERLRVAGVDNRSDLTVELRLTTLYREPDGRGGAGPARTHGDHEGGRP